MKLFFRKQISGRLLTDAGIEAVIKLAKENESLRNDLNNILCIMMNAKHGVKNMNIESNNSTASCIARTLLDNTDAIKEHFKF